MLFLQDHDVRRVQDKDHTEESIHETVNTLNADYKLYSGSVTAMSSAELNPTAGSRNSSVEFYTNPPEARVHLFNQFTFLT